MIKDSKYEPIEAFLATTTQWPIDNAINYFQFVYIVSGSGIHYFNDNAISFKAGYFVLLTPEGKNHFDFTERVEILIIRYHLSCIKTYRWKTINYLEELLFSVTQTSGKIVMNAGDHKLCEDVVQSIITNLSQKKLYYQDLNVHYINALIVIVARSLSEFRPMKFSEKVDGKIEAILSYIESNIYNPELLKTQVICEKFSISPNYFSIYFKKNCGVNLKDYLTDYKLRLIEHRLKYSDKRINELVEEFGFADESHINKFYKRHKGQSISKFRKSIR